MTDRRDAGDDLARLVREAADQVQPRPALDAIRARTVTAPKESAMSIARTWVLGGLGGAVATAAVIGGVYLASSNGGDDHVTPGPAASPTQSVEPTPSESASSTPPAGAGETVTVPVYLAGDTPAGVRLYREFQRTTIPEGGDLNEKVGAALTAAIAGHALDRDHRTLWPEGTEPVTVVAVRNDGISISLAGASTLHDRPAGMSAQEASLAVEQLIYTAQAAAGQGRLPVQLLLDEKHTDTILGVPTAEPLSNGPVLDTLSHVNISSPAEGDEVTGDTLRVTGVANSFEANVVVKLQRYEGTYVAFQEPVTAEGWMGEKLFPFSGSFDISKLEPGKYVLTATTDDPSGGAEGPGAYTDSKVITVR
ncbi:Gmad2 immunoglobulin-like domain-containing protein [Nocardioides jiangxiensis]|uniref:Gmad2 immunoglobulin-like domain-containing protein n=1 Tax=Nocardioides jiangxiensis TaxID=3064524 RepID=A0ABT9B0N3_9ACTN|nr:Gmad2 immunoglobulin-like domain-containing protein [Nocardioides sp. WY-20]MDO7867182.1 Gmad2 immunoglobulin-like domain-containing protein [Nocardioides sp. WY-20]